MRRGERREARGCVEDAREAFLSCCGRREGPHGRRRLGHGLARPKRAWRHCLPCSVHPYRAGGAGPRSYSCSDILVGGLPPFVIIHDVAAVDYVPPTRVAGSPGSRLRGQVVALTGRRSARGARVVGIDWVATNVRGGRVSDRVRVAAVCCGLECTRSDHRRGDAAVGGAASRQAAIRPLGICTLRNDVSRASPAGRSRRPGVTRRREARRRGDKETTAVLWLLGWPPLPLRRVMDGSVGWPFIN